MCCKLLGIDEIPDKQDGHWCPHAAPGARPGACTIYEDRPQSCRDFRCAWLHGTLPDDWKPDRLKAVIVGNVADERLMQVYEDPHGPEVSKGKLVPWIRQCLNRGLVVCVVRGERSRMLGDDKLIADVLGKTGWKGKILGVTPGIDGK